MCSRYFVGRKHFRKSERVCRSFLELKRVVTMRALRFQSGFRGRASGNYGLKHQGSSLESSRIDPLWTKAIRLDPFLNKDRVFRFQKLKITRSTHRNILCPFEAWYNHLFLLCTSSMYIFIVILCNNMVNLFDLYKLYLSHNKGWMRNS